MKRHPTLDRIIEVSVEEADKLFILAEGALQRFDLKVMLVNENCSMALCPGFDKEGKPGYKMGKVSDAAIMSVLESDEIINAHNPTASKALKVHGVSPFLGYSRAAERINQGLENCIELHNNNNRLKEGPND